MRFDNLALNGFRCFAGSASLDFVGGPGLVLVTGENRTDPLLAANGVGKSTLFDGVCWVLYGKTGRGSRGPGVLSDGSTGPCVGQLTGDHYGKPFTITRQQSPNKLVLDYDSAQAVDQKALDQFIGFGYDEFLRGVYHVQGAVGFIQLKPQPMLDELAGYLKLQVYDLARNEAVARCQSAELSSTAARADILGAADTLARLATQRDALAADSTRHARERLQQARQAARQLTAARQRLQRQQAAWDQLRQNNPLPDRTEWLAAKAKLNTISDAFRAWCEKSSAAGATMAKLRKALKAGECPTCGQLLHDASRVRKELRDAQERQDEAEEHIVSTRERMNAAHDRETELNEALQEETGRIVGLTRDAEHKVELIEQEIGELEREQRRIAALDDPYQQQLDRMTKLADDLHERVEQAKAVIAAGESELATYGYWRKGFKDLKLYVVNLALVRFQLAANNALRELGMTEWQVALSSESMLDGKGKLEVSINRGDGVARTTADLSYGELQRVTLAFEIGLGDLCLAAANTSFNIELWDEPSTWLSEQGVRALLGLLERRALATGRRIYVADHRLLDYPWSDVVQVFKMEEGSHVHARTVSDRQEVRPRARAKLRVSAAP